MYVSDITKQKEEKLNLSIAMQHAGMLYWEYDIPNAVIYANPATQRWFGLPEKSENYPEDYLKLGFVLEEYIPTYKDAIKKIQEGADYTEFDALICAVHQDYEWMRIRMTSVKDSDGKPVRAICTGEMIAEYKNLENRFMTTLRQNNISNWTYDIKRRTILLNARTYYAFERNKKNEISNVPDSQIAEKLCPPEDEPILRRLYERVNSGEKQVEETLRFLDSKTKEYRWKKCIYTVIEDNRGESTFAIGSAIDIEDQIEQKRKYEAAVEYRKHTQMDNLIFSAHCSVTEDEILELTDLSQVNLQQKFGCKRNAFFLGFETMIIDEDKRKEYHALASLNN